MLTVKQIRFAQEYCIDQNATQAAIRAQYSEASAHVQGCELLKNPKIKEYIAERMEELSVAAGITTQAVLKRWWDIANADANELSQVRRVCCRHCHGFGHSYQWSEAEYMTAVAATVNAGKEAPDGMGGFGFDPQREPHPECPECGGEGYAMVYVADTRKLKGKAKALYAGVKQTKDGIQILTRDQDAALVNISKYLGMSKEVVDLTTFEAKPLTDFYGDPKPSP